MPFLNDEIIRLNTPFQVRGGYLSVRSVFPGVPQIERLCLVRKKDSIWIDSLHDLSGHVRISTPQEAYSFLSLPTSPRTLLMFDRNTEHVRANVIPTSRFNLAYLYGDKKLFDVIGRMRSGVGYRNGVYGIADGNILSTLRIPPIMQERSANGFIVGRPVFVDCIQQGHLKKLYYLTQWVSAYGDVRNVEWKRLPGKMLGSVEWFIFRPM